jgi:hypothetical protein
MKSVFGSGSRKGMLALVDSLVCGLFAVACAGPKVTAATTPPAPEAIPPCASASRAEPMPNASSSSTVAAASPTFADDLKFLEQHGPVIVLQSVEHAVLAISAKYQGRVMTSAVRRDGPSLGFINRKFIQDGKTGTAFDNYGGEDRFWLGPEGGQYALYFAPGKPFSFEHWQTPAAFQEGEWTVAQQLSNEVVFTRHMKLKNYAGTALELDVRRTVRLLDEKAVMARVGGAPLTGLQWVGYETVNQITNAGRQAWTKDKGAPSVWVLAMYSPSPDAFVVIPFEKAAEGQIVNDTYFGKVPPERLRVFAEDGFLLFKCDGQYRSKIGLGPARAREFAGSYSDSAHLLTVVNYDKPKGVTDYVNSMWEHQEKPYAGDVVNSYNDGPVEPGKASLGGFYEIETSSPAATLAPRASLTHVHRTLHFAGERSKLDPIARATLGVSLDRVAATQ